MNYEDLQLAIYNWVTDVLGIQVIWENQSEHRPERPYASLNLTVFPTKLGHDDARMVGDKFKVQGLREMTLSVNVYGAEAFEFLSDLQSSHEMPSIRQQLLRDCIVVVSTSEVRNLSELHEARFQTRGQMDVQLRTNYVAEDTETGYIERVEITDSNGETVTVNE